MKCFRCKYNLCGQPALQVVRCPECGWCGCEKVRAPLRLPVEHTNWLLIGAGLMLLFIVMNLVVPWWRMPLGHAYLAMAALILYDSGRNLMFRLAEE